MPFQNLIFKREPPWVKPGQANLLTLVAHYDSKIAPEGFIGATDSAAPCAMLMWVAKVVDRYVQRMYDEMQALEEGGTVEMDRGIQILRLDGRRGLMLAIRLLRILLVVVVRVSHGGWWAASPAGESGRRVCLSARHPAGAPSCEFDSAVAWRRFGRAQWAGGCGCAWVFVMSRPQRRERLPGVE